MVPFFFLCILSWGFQMDLCGLWELDKQTAFGENVKFWSTIHLCTFFPLKFYTSNCGWFRITPWLKIEHMLYLYNWLEIIYHQKSDFEVWKYERLSVIMIDSRQCLPVLRAYQISRQWGLVFSLSNIPQKRFHIPEKCFPFWISLWCNDETQRLSIHSL